MTASASFLKNASLAFAVAFLVAGVAGFIPNPLVGPNGYFVTNGAHNAVHLLTAAAFAFMATQGAGATKRFMQIFGVVYFLVGLLGFFVLAGSSEGMLLGLVHINQLDNWLHIGLGSAIAAVGFIPPQQAQAA